MRNNSISGDAALILCENIILLLVERKIIADDDVMRILEDSVSFYRHPDNATDDDLEHRSLVADLIEKLIIGRNIQSPLKD